MKPLRASRSIALASAVVALGASLVAVACSSSVDRAASATSGASSSSGSSTSSSSGAAACGPGAAPIGHFGQGFEAPLAIAGDAKDLYLAWVSCFFGNGASGISKLDLASGTSSHVLSGDVADAASSGDTLAVLDANGNVTLFDGASGIEHVLAKEPGATRVGMDATSVCWIRDKSRIRCAAIAGGAPIDVATGPTFTSIAVRDGFVYALSLDQPTSLVRAPVTGGAMTTLAQGNLTIQFAVSPSSVIAVSSKGELLSIPLTGGTPKVLATKMNVGAIVADASCVYWTSGPVLESISRMPIDGSAPPAAFYEDPNGAGYALLTLTADSVYASTTTMFGSGCQAWLDRFNK